MNEYTYPVLIRYYDGRVKIAWAQSLAMAKQGADALVTAPGVHWIIIATRSGRTFIVRQYNDPEPIALTEMPPDSPKPTISLAQYRARGGKQPSTAS